MEHCRQITSNSKRTAHVRFDADSVTHISSFLDCFTCNLHVSEQDSQSGTSAISLVKDLSDDKRLQLGLYTAIIFETACEFLFCCGSVQFWTGYLEIITRCFGYLPLYQSETSLSAWRLPTVFKVINCQKNILRLPVIQAQMHLTLSPLSFWSGLFHFWIWTLPLL